VDQHTLRVGDDPEFSATNFSRHSLFRPSDVMVAVIENSAADWSFDNGEAQFLTGDLA
jgi:hypothetical protein